MRLSYTILLLFVCCICAQAQYVFDLPRTWEKGEELLVLKDYDPQDIDGHQNGHFQQWDVGRIDGPCFKPIQIIPSVRYPQDFEYDLMIEDDLGQVFYLKESRDKLYLVAQENILIENIFVHMFIKYDENLIDYELKLNSSEQNQSLTTGIGEINYQALPDILQNAWSQYEGKNFRIQLTINRQVERGASGSLKYSIFEDEVIKETVTDVIELKIEVEQNSDWKALSPREIEPLSSSNQKKYRFFTANHFFPKSIIYVDENDDYAWAEYTIDEPFDDKKIRREYPSEDHLEVYPNPAYEYTKFQFENFHKGTYIIELKNILGQMVRTYSVDIDGNDAITIDLNPLVKGTYLYSVKDKSGRTFTTRRLIVLKP